MGALALLAGLAGVLLWAWMIAGPLRLASGLLAARASLTRAERALGRGDMAAARLHTLTARHAAQRAAAAYAAPNPFVGLARAVPAVDRLWGEAGHVVRAVELSARAAHGTLDIAQNALRGPERIIVPSGEGGSRIRIERIEEVGATISDIRQALRGVARELGRVDARALPARLRPDLADALDRARASDALLADAEAGFEVLPSFLGADGPRSYLFGFQNNAEQRGTGGAMLQFAVLTIDDGRPSGLGKETTTTVYDLDRERTPLDIELPEDAWYVRGIRDAQRFGNVNWSPDWPLSARLTLEYARAAHERCLTLEARGETDEPCPELPDIDGVFAVDPIAVQQMMEGAGPYRTRAGNYVSKRSIVFLTMYKAYGSYPIPSRRRAVLGQIVDGFYRRLLDPQQPAALVKGLGEALATKHMQIWMRDELLQGFVERMGWDGAIEQARNGDYLYVVEQNVGGNKLDYFDANGIEAEIHLGGRDASWTTTLSVDNLVFQPQPRWILGDSGPLHRPMLNLYVQPGARLEGFEVAGERLASPSAELAGVPGGPPAQHTERGKTVWSATLQVPPEGRGALTYRYTVPGVVQRRGQRSVYRLTIQHQPEVRPTALELTLRLPQGARAVHAAGFERRGRVLVYERPLDEDVTLEVSWRS